MTEKILYIAHADAAGKLPKVALETLGAAVSLSKQLAGSSLTVGLVGAGVQQIADSIAGCGADFTAVTGVDFEAPRYCTDAIAVEALVKSSGATIVLAPNTSRLARVIAGVTERVGGSVDTRICSLAVEGAQISAQRWYYRQRMLGSFSRSARPWIMLIDSGISAAYEGSTGTAAIKNVPVEAPAAVKRTEVTGIEAPQTDAQTIRVEAEVLFVAGAGWTKKQADGKTHVKEGEQLILGFLDKAKASLGSSKSLVDLKSEGEEVMTCMSHLNQVGQTGSSPRHQKGLATCCHGEEPHVVGWRFINERRAVNLDPNCGWAQGKADVLYVADAFAVMQKVNELMG